MVLDILFLILGVAGYIYANKELKKYCAGGLNNPYVLRKQLRLIKVASAALFIVSLASLLYPLLVA